MRFNSIEHLETWRRTGKFPSIHNHISQVITEHMLGRKVVDLCCAFGLLGQRVAMATGAQVLGVDGSITSIQAGEMAGIGIELKHLNLNRKTLETFLEWLTSRQITVLLARRAFPELFGEDLEFGRRFARRLHEEAGITEIFLEGRAKTKNAVNALSDIDLEVSLLSEHFTEYSRIGAVSYLVAK